MYCPAAEAGVFAFRCRVVLTASSLEKIPAQPCIGGSCGCPNLAGDRLREQIGTSGIESLNLLGTYSLVFSECKFFLGESYVCGQKLSSCLDAGGVVLLLRSALPMDGCGGLVDRSQILQGMERECCFLPRH